MTVFLDISRISKRFITDGAVFEALKDVDLKIAKGEFITLIGHSGCGKSTVLNILAGLLDVTDGGIFLEGSQITEPGPDRAVVFQNHALMPWLDVYGNVELAVNASRAPKGSSINNTFGCMASARAMPTRCFIPPDISLGIFLIA